MAQEDHWLPGSGDAARAILQFLPKATCRDVIAYMRRREPPGPIGD
jgi:hypothetical protein